MKPASVLFLLSGFAAAQGVFTPPANPVAPPPSQDTTVNRPPPQEAKSPYGQEIPMLDPAAETIQVGGVTIPLGDNRLLKARFEKYLSQPPEDNAAAMEYRTDVKQILNTISPFNPGGPKLYEAFTKLPRAAAYPGDAGICSSLAEAIVVAMTAKNDADGLKALNASIEAEKHKIIAQADWDARHERDKTLGEAQPAGGTSGGANPNGGRNTNGGNRGGAGSQTRQNQPATNAGTGANSLKYAETLRRIAEIEAMKKLNVGRNELQIVQAKAQYQVNMIQWFVQRRYEHVLMAARFYNQIWKDGDSTLRIDKNSDVAKLFSQSVGVNPTVGSLDSLSSEAIREVDRYIAAFDLMLSRNELHSASQRLMEAYALGEYMAPVATLPLEKKQRVSGYVRDLHELYGTLQARDYTKAKELATNLKSTAKDFPSSKVDSAIAGYTLAADLAIEEAKAHLYAKEKDKAAEKIKAATEIWPTNPKLAEFRELMGGASPLVMARNDFDRLLNEKNFRQILDRQYELAPAIKGDPDREDAFRQIITNLTKIEIAIKKAEEFSKSGQNEAAYEQLAELRESFPDDPKLGRELELLVPKVAKFREALNQAEGFEKSERKQTGSALAWYLEAKDIFPNSKYAKDGIERVLNEIMPDDVAPSTGREGASR